MDSFDGLKGDELIEKIEELKEDDYGVQDRIYECGFVLNGEPSYKNYFQALAKAKGKKTEDIFLDYFLENEVPFLAFEVAKKLMIMYFHGDLIDELNDKNIEFFKAFKIIKNFALKINYKGLYKTGFIKNYRNIEEIDEALKGPDLIKKITNKDGSMEYDTELIMESGYVKYDEALNEFADVISFFEEVNKIKKINLDNIDLDNFNVHQIRKDIQDIINTNRKYYAFDFTCFNDVDDLELYALTERINFEVVLIDSSDEYLTGIHSQEFRAIEESFISNDEQDNYLPPGKYWIGDLSYVMEDYFDKHYCLVENGTYQRENGINFARFSTAYGDGFYYDYEGNEYGVDTANIGCISIDGILEEANGDLGKYHIFDYPFKCVWHETGGYIQYGDIWIQTDTLDQFILPPHIFTLKGKALLLFGDKFLKNDKFLPEIKNKDAEYWLEKSRGGSYGDIVDKTVKEIYLIKSKILKNEYEPKRCFSCLLDNHGSSQTAEAFSRIFKEIFDIEEDDQRRKIISFLDSKDLDNLNKIDYKMTKTSSLNLEQNQK
tara:strand:- start:108 stop:1748 length:1641 start_codon:yes stop_codon:yes gene_type:complete